MSQATEPAFEVILPEPELTQFEHERRAYFRLLPDLLSTHRGQYVEIHGEQVVDNGPVRIDVAMRVQRKIGPGDIYVGLVSVEPLRVVRSGIRRVLGR